MNEQCGGDPVARGYSGEDERLLDVLRVALPGGDSRGLLRGIIEQPAHLMGIQSSRASGGRGRAEIFRDAVGAAVGRHLIRHCAESHGDARSDVIAERDGAEEPCPVDAELFAGGECGGDDGASGMRLRWRMRVVGFVGMGQHAVGERGLDGAANDVGGGDGGHFLAGMRARKLQRDASWREIDAGDHGRKRVEDVVFGFFDNVIGQGMSSGVAHVGAEARHHRAEGRFGRADR